MNFIGPTFHLRPSCALLPLFPHQLTIISSQFSSKGPLLVNSIPSYSLISPCAPFHPSQSSFLPLNILILHCPDPLIYYEFTIHRIPSFHPLSPLAMIPLFHITITPTPSHFILILSSCLVLYRLCFWACIRKYSNIFLIIRIKFFICRILV